MIGILLRAALLHVLLAGAVGIGATANAQTLALVGGKVYASPDAVPSTMRSSSRPTASSPRSAAAATYRCRPMRASLIALARPWWPASGTATSISRKRCGGTPTARRPRRSRAHAGDADAMGFHVSVGSSVPTRATRCRCAAASMPAKSSVPIFSSPAAFSQGMAIPPISCRRCKYPRRRRRSGRRRLARSICASVSTASNCSPASYKGEDKPVVNMEAAIAKAAVDVAHAQGRPVFAHPQNTTGVEAVIAAGVDVMAHTVAVAGLSREQLARFKQQGTALTPTLSLFAKLPCRPRSSAPRRQHRRSAQGFSENGNPVLFGTDVGYIRSMTPRSNIN